MLFVMQGACRLKCLTPVLWIERDQNILPRPNLVVFLVKVQPWKQIKLFPSLDYSAHPSCAGDQIVYLGMKPAARWHNNLGLVIEP